MKIEDRIARWREEDGGPSMETIDLLRYAENEIRGLRAAIAVLGATTAADSPSLRHHLEWVSGVVRDGVAAAHRDGGTA